MRERSEDNYLYTHFTTTSVHPLLYKGGGANMLVDSH